MKTNPNKVNSIPFMIEKNIGQHQNESKFVLRNNNGTVFFLESEIVFALIKPKEGNEEYIEDKAKNKRNTKPIEYEVEYLKMMLENSNKAPKLVGEDEFDCKINYFKGSDASKWTTNIPIYEKVTYKDVYPNIDLVYYGNQGMLEHDFIIHPNGDVNDIKMVFEGYDKIEQDEDGNILIYVKENIVQMSKPKTYQEIDNIKVEVESNFIMVDDGVKFNIASYDKSKALVIDPQIIYGSYLGGSVVEYGRDLAVDSNENAYITGYTFSTTQFPIIAATAYQKTFTGTVDAFLIKIDTKLSGISSLKYGTYLAGIDGITEGNGVAVDDNENVYITGFTNSTSGFPLKNAYQDILIGDFDAFLIKIDTNASGEAGLLYGTYLGAKNGYTEAWSVAVDSNENAYITGGVFPTDPEDLGEFPSEFPITDNAYQGEFKGSEDVFLIKIDTNASGDASLLYGTYISGTGGGEFGQGVAVDSNENAYITGETYSTDFPTTTTAYQQTKKSPDGAYDAFLVKIYTKEIDPDDPFAPTSPLLYGTYLGGIGGTGFRIQVTEGNAVAVDQNGNAYISGETYSSSQFPLKNAYQNTLNGTEDAFLIKIDTNASGDASLLYGTYLGGNLSDIALGVAIDARDNAYIAGWTTSSEEFPLNREYQSTLISREDAFLIKLNTLSSDLVLEKSTSKSEVSIGENIVYTIKVTNNGPHTATNIVVTDNLQSGLKINSYTTTSGSISGIGSRVTWTIPSLEVGETELAMIVVTPSEYLCSNRLSGVFIKNTASLTTDNNIVNSNTTTSDTITYINCNKKETFSDLVLQKTTCKCNYNVNEEITYCIKIKNNGPDIATNVVMTDCINEILQILSLKVNCGRITQKDNLVIWNLVSLGIGEEVEAIIKVKLKYCMNSIGIKNKATVKSDNTLLNPQNSSDTVEIYIR